NDFGATYALRNDGTVWAWGRNSRGELGNGSFEGAATPVLVSGLTGVTAIAGGSDNGYAVRSDGTVWAWGWGAKGRLGTGVDCTGFECEQRVPVQITTLSGATQVAAFNDGGYALKSDGTVWSWGDNYYHALGNDSAGYAKAPVQVPGVSGISAITAAMGAG